MREGYRSELVYRSELAAIGKFRCAPESEMWHEENTIGPHAVVVFPRNGVGIHQADREPVVSTPNNVMFYNAHQLYRRSLLCTRGDVCEFVSLREDVWLDLVGRCGVSDADRVDRLFPFAHGPGDPGAYMAQRRMVNAIDQNPSAAEHGAFDEIILAVAARSVRAAFGARAGGSRRKEGTVAAHRELVGRAVEWIYANMSEPIVLDDLARAVHSSVFHLCRVFRVHTGLTVQAFAHRLRALAALEPLADGERSLTGLGLRLGYSSGGHFGRAFRAVTGVTPSAYRADPGLIDRAALSKIVCARTTTSRYTG